MRGERRCAHRRLSKRGGRQGKQFGLFTDPVVEHELYDEEIAVDLFAGGGGGSEGVRQGLGRSPHIAVNHCAEAVAMHKANHPDSEHHCGDVYSARPLEATRGRRVGLLWASPDCTFFSKARGSKPFRDRRAAKRRRALAHVVIVWAREVRPRIIMLENVEEFLQWGPLANDGRPDKARRGLSFRNWVGKLRAQGYVVEWRELRACDFGSPTSRKRLFVIARRDGLPIVWPQPTHGPNRAEPYRTAAECIDWDRPCPSIFGRKKPLAANTLARIVRGIERFVIGTAAPFIVPTNHGGDRRVHSINEPLRTITGGRRGDHALVMATLQHSGNGERQGQAPRVYDIRKPLGTVMGQGQKHALVKVTAAFIAKHNDGHASPGSAANEPLHTITAQRTKGLAIAHLLKLHGSSRVGQDVRQPMPTVRAQGTHLAEVRALLIQYNGASTGQRIDEPLATITSKDRFGLVTVANDTYEIVDVGLRMLNPRELFRAQGFTDDYVIDVMVERATKSGRRYRRRMTITAQVRMVGNSVPPQLACALVRANYRPSTEQPRRKAA